jgi:phage gp46-like protein
MTDIALFAAGSGDEYDAVLLNGDFIGDDSLRTAVLVSWLSDAEYLDSEDGDPRGFWADALSNLPGYHHGSLFWTLARSKQTDDTLGQFKSYGKQALAWMLSDGIASSIETSAQWAANGYVYVDADLSAPTGPQRIRLKYLWQQSAVVTPASAIKPGQVLISLASAGTSWTAMLSWTPTANAASYQVYMGLSAGGESGTPVATTGLNHANVAGLAANTSYFFRVIALDADGNPVAVSAEIDITTGALP